MFTIVNNQLSTFVINYNLSMKLKDLNDLYSLVKTPELSGRYITNEHIEKCLANLPSSSISVIGQSVEKRPIYSLAFGKGTKKILLWSQMHGNESTTTKALFDCFNLFLANNDISKKLLRACTLLVIPILNPDGAERYTRLNANNIDLNRDAQNMSQPESIVLRNAFNDFKPDYCFNLHGQRTIYNVGNTNVSSTLSFLSPSQDAERLITPNRKISMAIIASIYEQLQQELPSGIARYDDAFNLNCVGDTFQSLGIPTILYEAGHFPNDYNREEVRRLIFTAILLGLNSISNGIKESDYETYFEIPENSKQFYDIIIRNGKLSSESTECIDIGIQFEERLIDGKIDFIPVIESISTLEVHFGHNEINAKNNIVKNSQNAMLSLGNEIDFVLINNEKISLKP